MVFKKIGSRIKEINHPLKVAVRIGVAVPIFLFIIFLWSYYIVKASEPLIKNDNIQPPSHTSTSGPSVFGWNIFDTFCASQITETGGTSTGGVTTGGSGVSTVSPPAPLTPQSVQPLTCPTGNVEYRCDGSLPTGANAPNPYSITQSSCRSDKQLDTSKRWCDVPNLPTSGSGGVQSVLDRKIQTHCCKDKDYESNINYWGMGIYLVITLPLIYLLIEKILSNFIIRDIKVGESEVRSVFKDQYEWLGGYISKNGALLVILVLCIYYIVFPLFRFFFVSYKCEDVISTASSNCNKPCTTDDDCTNLHGTGCLTCINDFCQNPSFTDGGANVALGNIELSVCSLRSIINDLTEAEINDLYNRFTPGSATTKTAKITAINTFINNELNNKKVTSYYYKFYPRQEISINDTTNPFRVRLPLPKVVPAPAPGVAPGYEPIPGFNYLLNNYIELDDYIPPSAPASGECTATTEIMCNKNHNCKWMNQSCQHSGCPGQIPKRYKLPGPIQSVLANQSTDDNLSLHNKVFKNGKDYNKSTNSYPENMYPCNNVVISNSLKERAKNTTKESRTISHDEMSEWINHFELKRIECADKQGKCYMNNYACETEGGTPIPLKKLDHPIPNTYTVAELTNTGCQNALYPCDGSTITAQNPSPPCTALKESNGYILEEPQGGTCKYVEWTSTGWKNVNTGSNSNTKKAYCIPNNISPPPSPASNYALSFTGARVSDWIQTPNVAVNTQCNAVNRMPRSNISDPSPASVPYYFRWSPIQGGGDPLCSDWQGGCIGLNKVKNMTGTYTGSRQQEMCCIDQTTTSNPISLYVRGIGVPRSIAGITPKGTCGEWTGSCPTGKTKITTGEYSIGSETTDCCSN
jgi:hypothetical protein